MALYQSEFKLEHPHWDQRDQKSRLPIIQPPSHRRRAFGTTFREHSRIGQSSLLDKTDRIEQPYLSEPPQLEH